MNFFYFFTLNSQALDLDPYPDPDQQSFSKPWIQIREKWIQICKKCMRNQKPALIKDTGSQNSLPRNIFGSCNSPFYLLIFENKDLTKHKLKSKLKKSRI